MSVQSEIDRIITAVGNAYSKVSQKGGTVPASQTVSNLATAIDSIPAGGGAPNLQSKSVTYTANGTNTIAPDSGYDGLSSVDVTVNVASGGGSGGISDFACIAWMKGPSSDYAIAEIDESHDYLVINSFNGEKAAIISNNSFVFISPYFSSGKNDHLEISGSGLYYFPSPLGSGLSISVFEISY